MTAAIELIALLVVAVAGLGLIWAARDRPGAVLSVLICLVPITAGLARGFPIPGFKLSEILAVGLAACLVLAADYRIDARWRTLDFAFAAFAIGHFVLSIASSWLALAPLTTRGLGLAAGSIQFLIYFRAVVVAVQLSGRSLQPLRLLVWSSIPVTVLALAQGLGIGFLTDFVRDFAGSGQAEYGSVSRATGPFPHAQVLAPYLTAIVVLGVALLLNDEGLRRRRGFLAAMALAVAALVMTLGIAAMAGALVASVIVIAFSPDRRKPLTVLGIAVLVAGIAFSPILVRRYQQQTGTGPGTYVADRNPLIPQSIAYRASVWDEQMLPAVADRPLTGYGPELPRRITWRFSESMYLTLLLRGGVPLLALWFLLVTVVVVTTWRLHRVRGDPAVRVAAQALFGLIIVFSVMQLIQPYFTYGGFAHVFWAIAGVMVARARLLRGPEAELA